MHDYKILFENNRKWVEQKLSKDPQYFSKLANGQTPDYLWIGCSDSRVPANEVTGTNPGEVFVHRNIANLVLHNDMNLLSVLSYAVEVLCVKHIIVCGHYGCGGILAAMNNNQYGLIDNWLRNIKDVYADYSGELEQIKDDEQRARRLTELNVMEQVKHLCKTTIVQNAWKNKQPLHVHGWIYDIHDGLLDELVSAVSDTDILHNVYKFS